MSQSITLNPTLKVLLPVFRQRCADIKVKQSNEAEATVTPELVAELRLKVLLPLEKPRKAELAEELILLATLSVVIDLITQGWRIAATEPSVVLDFPEALSSENEKDRIRRAHLIERASQIREPSVLEFIRGMEKRRLTPKGWHSIFSVMRDGEDLARHLDEIMECRNPEIQKDLLARIVQPYVQVVDSDSICPQTGLRLNDMWRYFRHTWVTTYKSVPGRSMAVLVRDAGAPNHPVIGIASLANSVVQQATRDKWIGWDSSTVVERFRHEPRPKKCVQWLLFELNRFVKGLYLKDLIKDGLVTRAEIHHPSDSVIRKLYKESDKAIKRHRLYPHAAKHKGPSNDSPKMWVEYAETDLFRSKRSRQLAKLLAIRQLLQRIKLDPEISAEAWRQLFESSRFRHAVGQIVRFLKAERVGINMMDIAVCGAVAPYNVLLGGKLVALLLCSPEIVRAYQARYENRLSLIASSMRGASVQRRAQLVLLCTTSLYGSPLNQYSRLKMPTNVLGGKSGGKVEYECLGTSEGFGSFHFSKDSLRMMETLLGRSKEARKVNSIFGEGVNPLMRKIREGLELLGLPPDILLKHGSKRLIYGVALANNFGDYLLGLSATPKYLIPGSRPKLRTELIADFWRERWLQKRLSKPGILEEIARHTCAYPIRHGAQVELPHAPDDVLELLESEPVARKTAS